MEGIGSYRRGSLADSHQVDEINLSQGWPIKGAAVSTHDYIV